jgi:acylphosphatase
MSDKNRASLTVNGLVQGVFFRYRAQMEAKRLGLTGWVKNNDNGTVMSVVEGEKDRINEFIKWCHQGPDQAQVDEVAVAWQNFTGEFKDFNIL